MRPVPVFGSVANRSRKPEPLTKPRDEKIAHTGNPQTTEKEFLEKFHGKLTLSIGAKGSGKSFMMLHYLHYAMKNGLYSEYHLVLPVWGHEQNSSYSWIEKMKTKAKIFIYSEHDLSTLEKLQKRKQPFQDVFYGIDDSTGSWKLQADPEEIKYLSRLRHFNCTMWVVVHTVRAALPASLRAQVDFLFIYLNTNRTALMALYEEWMSVALPTFRDFMDLYKNKVLNVEYGAMLIFCRQVGKYDLDVSKWNLLKEKL